MADGHVETYDRRMLMDGTLLNNNLHTIFSPVSGTGSELTITLNAEGDGHMKVCVFDEIVITGVPEPTTLALLLCGGLVALRRRR